MMRTLVGVSLLGFVAALSAASGPPVSVLAVADSASGRGTISFGEDEDGHGAGLFRFNVRRGALAGGSLLFAAEEPHNYPDIVVRMNGIEKAKFAARSVKFSGKGNLQDQPVSIEASAFDGQGTKRPDSFSIRCIDAKGKVVFEAKGEVTIGNISVGAAE